MFMNEKEWEAYRGIQETFSCNQETIVEATCLDLSLEDLADQLYHALYWCNPTNRQSWNLYDKARLRYRRERTEMAARLAARSYDEHWLWRKEDKERDQVKYDQKNWII